MANQFDGHPGSLTSFDWPVTRADAISALEDFVEHRLPSFGDYQDALWTGEPFLYHSGLASAMNLKLLSPAEVIEAAEDLGKGLVLVNTVGKKVDMTALMNELYRRGHRIVACGYDEKNHRCMSADPIALQNIARSGGIY